MRGLMCGIDRKAVSCMGGFWTRDLEECRWNCFAGRMGGRFGGTLLSGGNKDGSGRIGSP